MADDTEEDPNLPGNRWRYLQHRRVAERQDFIDRKLMPDPNVRYRLDEAITMKGTCEEMCPELERHEREAKALIDPWEYLGGPNSTLRPRRIDHQRAVKIYQRGSGDLTIPSDLRTVKGCFKTTKYLWRMISEHRLSHTHAFVRDRTRAVRLDLRVQMEEVEGRAITRQCVRFHILSLHALRHLPGDRFDFGTEAEQIGQTLQSLRQLESPNTLASTPEFLGYYVLFHIRNEPPKVSPNRLNSSLVLLFAQHFRASVAANSPPFAKNSVLKVGQDGIALWDEFVGAMESPTSALAEKHFHEANWSMLHRRSVIFLIGCLLEWHFGSGCVSGLAVRRRSVVDGFDPGIIVEGEENTGEHDLRIIECDVEDGAPPAPTQSKNAPQETSINEPRLNPAASPFVPTFQSSSQANGFGPPSSSNPPSNASPFSSSPAPQMPPSSTFSGSSPAPTVDPFRAPSPAADLKPNAFATAFTRESAPGVVNAFFPSSRPTSPAPPSNPFASAPAGLFAPKATSAFSSNPSPFGNPSSSATSSIFANPPSTSTSPFGAPTQTTPVGPPQAQSEGPDEHPPFQEEEGFILTPPTPERSLPPIEEPLAPQAQATNNTSMPSIFVTGASPSFTFAKPAQSPSFEPVAPKFFAPKVSKLFPSSPTPGTGFGFPPTPPQPLHHEAASRGPTPSTSASSSLFATPLSSTPPSRPPSQSSMPTIAPSAPLFASSKPPTSIVPPIAPTSQQQAKPKPPPAVPTRKNEILLQKELVYSLMLRTITSLHVSDVLADEFSRRRILRSCRPLWESWVTRVRKKLERKRREVERAQEWSREVEEGRRVRRRLADDLAVASKPRETASKGDEIGKVVLERAEKRKRYWERGSFLQALQEHVTDCIAVEGSTTGFPALWTVHLSTNERFQTSAVWMKTKFGVDGDSTRARNYLALSLSGEIVESKRDNPGVVVFETTPLESDLALDDRSKILENDCARLRAVVEALSSERHYSTALVVILWGQDTPMPISATALSLGLDPSKVILLHLGGSKGSDDPDADFRKSLKKMKLDVVGERVMILSVRDLAKHLVDIWSDGLENTIALCRGADQFNWQLSGYVLSSSITQLNMIASIVYRVVATQAQSRYSEWRLPNLDGSRFTFDTQNNLRALDEYLSKDVFEGDNDVESLRISLEARKVAITNEYTGATCASFARGMAQILLNRLEGTLTPPSNGQSLRLRIPKTRMASLEGSFKREVEKAEADLGVLRRSVAAGVWAKTVERKDSVLEMLEGRSESAMPRINGSTSQFVPLHSDPAPQAPLTLDDLRPVAPKPSIPRPNAGIAPPTHGLALPRASVAVAAQLPPRPQSTIPVPQAASAQGASIGALRSRAKDILAKYKGQNGSSNPSSPMASPRLNGDLTLSTSLPKSSTFPSGMDSLHSSTSSAHSNGRASMSSMHSHPFGIRKKLSYTDLLQLKTDEVLNTSVRKWGEK